MADFTALKTAIQNAIKQNGNEEITGNLLQEVLLAIVTTLGDGSIKELITALGSEATTRQQADGTLQQNINAEATTRGNADTTLQQNINAEAQARGNADTALGGRIDGVVSSIEAINDAIENGYVYAGIATPSSTPASGKVFYLALTAGTYTNFGNTAVTQGINILKYNGSAWSLDAFVGIDDAPTPSSNNLVKSGGVLDSIIKDGSAFDLSAYNGGATYADLNAALTALNALPTAYKRGGMSMKFVLSSDNKYAQYRCVAENFTTNTAAWIRDDYTKTINSVSDFEIGDGEGNVIAQFKDGNIKTKEFDSQGVNAKLNTIEEGAEVNNIPIIDTEPDLELSDDSGHVVAQFVGGGIRTKNFDSHKFVKSAYKNIFRLNKGTMADVEYTGWSLNSNKEYVTNNGSYGWNNMLLVNKEETISDKIWIFDFSIGTNGVAYFGSKGATGYNASTTNYKQSLVSVDFAGGYLNIHNSVPAVYTDIPTVAVRTAISVSSYENKKFRISLSRKNKSITATLYYLSNPVSKIAEVTCPFDQGGEPCGYLYDMPCCFSTVADIKIYNIEMNVPVPSDKICNIAIFGDSITEGKGAEANDGYAELLAKESPIGRVIISGRANGGIQNLIRGTVHSGRLYTEASVLRPEYVMVTIGTNDGGLSNFATYLQLIIDYVCTTLGLKLILNHIPMRRNGDDPTDTPVSDYINPLIDAAIADNADKGILCCKFDIATALNRDPSQGQNPAMFVDTAHPNKLGYAAMFEQIKIDCPELF